MTAPTVRPGRRHRPLPLGRGHQGQQPQPDWVGQDLKCGRQLLSFVTGQRGVGQGFAAGGEALNVSDLDAAVEFYGTLFDAAPHKRRPGYANCAIEQPPMKLVLFEQPEAGGTLNHLGVEVDEGQAVVDAAKRLADAGLRADVSEGELCCHAVQDKVWTSGPDAERWEVYVVADDNPEDDTPAQTQVKAIPGTDQSRTVCCT